MFKALKKYTNAILKELPPELSLRLGVGRNDSENAQNVRQPPALSAGVYAGSAVINLLALAMPITILQVYDRVLPNASLETLNALMMGLIGVVIVDTILKCLRAYQINWSAAAYTHKLSQDALSTIMTSKAVANKKASTAEHLERLASVNSYGDYLGSPARLIALDVLFIPIFAAVIIIVGGYIFFVPLILCIAFSYFGYRRTTLMKQLFDEREQTDARKNDFILETLKSMSTIKALAMEPLIMRRYERLQLTTSNIARKTMTVANDAQTFAALYASISTVGIVCLGAVFVIQGQLTIGALACCTLLSSQLLQPTLRSLSAWNEIQLADLKRDNIEKIFEGVDSQQTDTPKAKIIVERPAGLQLENLTIQHGNHQPLFQKLSFDIAPGSICAIRGADGSGRTSLLRALAGTYIPEIGNIKIGGVDVTADTFSQLSSQVGYIQQEPTVFRGSILENLTMFGQISVDASLEASKIIGLDTDVSRLPLGYDTVIRSASSADIPAAMAQQICIARVIARNPAVLLLDEATTAFDMTSDQGLQSALNAMRGKTTIVLSTHRPSMIDFADEAYRIENGTLVSINKTDTTSKPTNLQTVAPYAAAAQ